MMVKIFFPLNQRRNGKNDRHDDQNDHEKSEKSGMEKKKKKLKRMKKMKDAVDDNDGRLSFDPYNGDSLWVPCHGRGDHDDHEDHLDYHLDGFEPFHLQKKKKKSMTMKDEVKTLNCF